VQELEDLNQRLYASRVAKLRELRKAQDEKAALQVKLQDTLTELADSRQTAQQAAASLRTDRQFVSGILRKYQVLVDKFEARKAKADLADQDEMLTLRQSLVELRKQMNQAKSLSRVLVELEKTKIEAGELTNLLKFHKVDLAIVQAGSRQALSKAKAHKDGLFQALVGLETQLVRAKSDREIRLAEIASSRVQEKSMSTQVESEEQDVLEREVQWLQAQVAGTQEAIESYSASAKRSKPAKSVAAAGEGSEGRKVESETSAASGHKVSHRSDLTVKLLKYQVNELERQISEVKLEGLAPDHSPDPADASSSSGHFAAQPSGLGPAARRRPLTAGADGLDRRRTAQERASKMEAALSELKVELQRAEMAVDGEEVEDGEMSAEGLSEARRMSILAHIEAIESEMALSDAAARVEEEKEVLAGELEWLEGLISEAEKGHASETGDVVGLERLVQKDVVKVETKAIVSQLTKTRQQLQSALGLAMSAQQDLATVVEGLDGETADDSKRGKLVELGQQLDEALKSAQAQQQHGEKSQDQLSQRLTASESCVVQQQREILALRERIMVHGQGGADADEGVLEAALLKEDNLALEKELQAAMAANNLATGQIRLLMAKLREKGKGQDAAAAANKPEVQEPEDLPQEEHALRKRVRNEQPADHDPQSGLHVESADIAELALIWGMDTTAHLHLLWLPERSLRSALPVGWEQFTDRKGEVFYHEPASGFSTYMHPNDAKYHDMLLEIRSQLEPTYASGNTPAPTMNPEILEIERLRLREAAAAIERQAQQLRRERDALSKEKLRTTLSVEQQDEHRVKEWEDKKEEEIRAELARLREDETLQLQKAKEKMLVDLRDHLVKTERDNIRAELLSEEKQALAVERLKLRQRIIKEETSAIRKRLEEEEAKSVDVMREQIRDELRNAIKKEEEERLARETEEDAIRKGKYIKTPQEKQQDARMAQVQAAKKHQASLDAQRRQEVEEYAKYLGMDPAADQHLLWIAEMALTAPLPVGWSEHQDSAGNVFFFNKATGTSTYEHPLDASFKSYYSKIKLSGA
jgi:hypothetical protein